MSVYSLQGKLEIDELSISILYKQVYEYHNRSPFFMDSRDCLKITTAVKYGEN